MLKEIVPGLDGHIFSAIFIAMGVVGCTAPNPGADTDGTSGSGGGTDDCRVGAEGCSCTTDGRCETGLSCEGGVCVPPDDGTGGPGTCGDGILDDGEECDQGENNANDAICKEDCTLGVCGDGFVGPGEACDDGNMIDDDECRMDCTLPSCGDGVVQPMEECDDANDVDTDACTNLCKVAQCGDGIIQEGVEACDDGNMIDDDACSNSCEVQPVCGDGKQEQGELCYAPPNGVQTGERPVDLVLAEISGDEHLDLIVLHHQAPNDETGVLRILPGDGVGGLTMGLSLSSGGMEPTALAAGDIDGDGRADLVAVHAGSKDLSYLLGTGMAAAPFAAPYLSSAHDHPLRDVAVTGPSPDGKADTAYVQRPTIAGPPGTVTLHEGQDTSCYSGEGCTVAVLCTPFPFQAGDGPSHLAFATLEGESIARIVVGRTGSPGITVLEPASYMIGEPCHQVLAARNLDEAPNDVATGDLWGDGNDEIVASAGGEVVVLTIDPVGKAIQELFAVAVPNAPGGLSIGDLDGDGDNDIVVTELTGDAIAIILNNGDATFASPVELPVTGLRPSKVVIGDLNGDGLPDIITSNATTNGASIFLSNP